MPALRPKRLLDPRLVFGRELSDVLQTDLTGDEVCASQGYAKSLQTSIVASSLSPANPRTSHGDGGGVLVYPNGTHNTEVPILARYSLRFMRNYCVCERRSYEPVCESIAGCSRR